jgi:hypothetical protein
VRERGSKQKERKTTIRVSKEWKESLVQDGKGIMKWVDRMWWKCVSNYVLLCNVGSVNVKKQKRKKEKKKVGSEGQWGGGRERRRWLEGVEDSKQRTKKKKEIKKKGRKEYVHCAGGDSHPVDVDRVWVRCGRTWITYVGVPLFTVVVYHSTLPLADTKERRAE